ncbi:MAG: NADPH-dependent 7-cyano-7-deazaguanine reductase QueF [Paludibacter sp.]|nr:NADPH-dependent 7-cyano-7-deazaguanine reductase QueF [Paludibacter sp.]
MDFNLNDSLLGKDAFTPEKYDASLLFRIPRSENREHYGLEAGRLPFVGVDVWNCYEVSFMTDNGLPVSRMMKLIYSCESEFLVESKSLKLYLNSFNMEKLGRSVLLAEKNFVESVSTDLSNLLEAEVQAILFADQSVELIPFQDIADKQLTDLVPEEKLEQIEFSHFLESPDLLKAELTDTIHEYAFRSDLLRSNCRVTNQPDWGDLFVRVRTKSVVDLSSIVAYLVSFRKENHFHEEVVEMIYKRFWDAFKPEELMVAAMYTRRGGIDINPVRASHVALLDEAFVSSTKRLAKTLRQ